MIRVYDLAGKPDLFIVTVAWIKYNIEYRTKQDRYRNCNKTNNCEYSSALDYVLKYKDCY